MMFWCAASSNQTWQWKCLIFSGKTEETNLETEETNLETEEIHLETWYF
jgi:hypothetical protein